MNDEVRDEDLLAAVELLRFVADLCAGAPEELNVALCRFTHTYYPAHHLAAEVHEIGDRLAQALGFADLSLEPQP
jgi:hypothetical protein